MTTVAGEIARLAAQIPEPVFTEGMTEAERRAETDRWLADCHAQATRLDEEHLLLGIGRSAAVYMTHEVTSAWEIATAGRWFLALPERYMTPDKMTRPDWDHSHYAHDEHGHMGRRVTTLQRKETAQDRRVAEMLRDMLAKREI